MVISNPYVFRSSIRVLGVPYPARNGECTRRTTTYAFTWETSCAPEAELPEQDVEALWKKAGATYSDGTC